MLHLKMSVCITSKISRLCKLGLAENKHLDVSLLLFGVGKDICQVKYNFLTDAEYIPSRRYLDSDTIAKVVNSISNNTSNIKEGTAKKSIIPSTKNTKRHSIEF